MKTLKLFTKWFTRTGSEDKKKTTADLDYDPTKDFYKNIRKREAAEKQRLTKWREEFKKQRMSNYTYNTSIGQLPGSVFTSNGYINSPTITSSSIANSAITINGDPTNGSVTIDVPLKVNGRDIIKELDEIRDALLLLKRDVDMESNYPKLKEIKDEYERALEKYKTFDAIKESK